MPLTSLASEADAFAETARRNSCDSCLVSFGFGSAGTAAATAGAGAGATGATAGAATGATAGVAGATAAALAAGAASEPSAATSAGGFQSGVIASLKPMWRWFWWAASVK